MDAKEEAGLMRRRPRKRFRVMWDGNTSLHISRAGVEREVKAFLQNEYIAENPTITDRNGAAYGVIITVQVVPLEDAK